MIKFIASDIYVVSDTSAIIEDTFEFEIGDELYPVDTVHLTQPYGENVSDGDGGSALMFEDIELVRDNTSNIVQDLLDLYEGFSYGQYDLRTIGDPFIGVGNYIKVLDYDYGEHDVLVTERKFTDNGVWRTEIKADIPEQEEINTNYVGTFEQRTEIIVDKVNKEIEAVVADTSSRLNEFDETIDEHTASITMVQDSIRDEVTHRERIESDLETLTTETSTMFEQTKDEFNFEFNTLLEQVENIDDNTRAQLETISKYIRFVDGNIILGEEGNELVLRISNDKIQFLQDNNEVAYFNNNKLYVTDGEFINSLRLGNFSFYPLHNGNLTFRKVVN